jgi:hypothetical protein
MHRNKKGRRMTAWGQSRPGRSKPYTVDVRFAPKADKQADITLSPLSADFVAEVADESRKLRRR